MRPETEIEVMLNTVESHGYDVDLEVNAIRDTLIWVLHPETDDGRITEYLPE
jgi:hypothetical protein